MLTRLRYYYDEKGKGKGLPQQAEVPQGVSGRLRSRVFFTLGTTKGGRSSALLTDRLYFRRNPWYSSLEAELTPGYMVLSVTTEKIPVTPPGIDPEIVRLVAQCLNHYATPGPPLWCSVFYYNNVSYFIATICHILLQQCVIFYYNNVSYFIATMCHFIATICHILLQQCVIFYFNNVSYFIATMCHILLQQCVVFYCNNMSYFIATMCRILLQQYVILLQKCVILLQQCDIFYCNNVSILSVLNNGVTP
jgi:hypothetical protein